MMYCIIMKLAALTCMPVLIVIYNSMNCYGQRDVSRVTTWVSRRSIDFYRHSGDKSHTICELEDPTFMVDERNCTNNEDILNSNDICVGIHACSWHEYVSISQDAHLYSRRIMKVYS